MAQIQPLTLQPFIKQITKQFLLDKQEQVELDH